MRVLVVEDDSATRAGLTELIAAEAGAEVKGVGSVAAARAALAEFAPDLCLTDLMLPDGEGLDVVRASKALEPGREVVVLTGHGSVEIAVEAMKAGAFDFLLKPLKAKQLAALLSRFAGREPEREALDIGERAEEAGRYGAIVGKSGPILELLRVVARVARSDAPVMVSGESGSGKEVVASTIHELSRRRGKPFVAVNCGAVSATLIESELFGHEKGAFTGADKRRAGYFETAHGGTLFLDEVTEMSTELQVKFLRVLESRTFRRVGGNDELDVDVRVISSSNRDLAEAVRTERFRADLYYRLNVLPIPVPPLRERKEDIGLLAAHFLGLIERGEQAGVHEIEPGAVDALREHGWPGNVRELRNVVHRAYVLSEGPAIQADAVRSVLGSLGAGPRETTGPAGSDRPSVPLRVGDSLAAAEHRLLQMTLDHVKGNKRLAAEILKVSLKTIYNKMKRYGIER